MSAKKKQREEAQRKPRRLGIAGAVVLVLAGAGWYGLYWQPKQIAAEAQASLEQGDVLRGQGQIDEAAGQYRRAIELKPDWAQAWSNLAVTDAALERFAAAIPNFERALALDPKHFEAQIGYAISLDGLGDFLGAEKHYEKALAIRSDFGGVYYNLGYLYQKQGLYVEAAEQYEEAVRRLPN